MQIPSTPQSLPMLVDASIDLRLDSLRIASGWPTRKEEEEEEDGRLRRSQVADM